MQTPAARSPLSTRRSPGMTTPPAPSARPPSSRRFEALDSPAAKAFVQGADPRAGEPAGAAPPSEPPRREVVERAAPPPVEPPRAPPPPSLEIPAVATRRPAQERKQPLVSSVSSAPPSPLLYIADKR